MEIEKAYFTVAEIRTRWSMAEHDLVYLAENDQLRLSIRVFGLFIELGDIEVDDDRWHRMPTERRYWNGLLDLRAVDAHQIFRRGNLDLTEFRVPGADYATLLDEASPVQATTADLLIRREERDRWEALTGFAGAQAEPPLAFRLISPDYHEVVCQGQLFHLGPIQAEVLRALHTAACSGEPWQNGKSLLSAAGSRSLRMADVFKSQPNWRALIESNGRGAYRLAPR